MLSPAHRRRTLPPCAGHRGAGSLGRVATRRAVRGLPCDASTVERRRSHPRRARMPRAVASCPRPAHWPGRRRVARCISWPRILSGPVAVPGAQPTVPIANNWTTTDRPSPRAPIPLSGEQSTDPDPAGHRRRLAKSSRQHAADDCQAGLVPDPEVVLGEMPVTEAGGPIPRVSAGRSSLSNPVER
jgi:hypothetical protein